MLERVYRFSQYSMSERSIGSETGPDKQLVLLHFIHRVNNKASHYT